jgi:hypothetical protein
MSERDEFDTSRAKSKKKTKKRKPPARSENRGILLLVGTGIGGLLVLLLVIWGLVSLFSGGGSSSAIVAQARPAEKKPDSKTAIIPPEQIPSAAPNWKVTVDDTLLASGLTSAIVLPDGKVESVLFANPSAAQAAVIIAQPALKADPKTVVNIPIFPIEWVQVDLKAGRVLNQISLGNSRGAPMINSALSPSGDRLAIVVPTADGSLQIWDKSGKKIAEWKEVGFPGLTTEPRTGWVPGQEWLAFLDDQRVVVSCKGKLLVVDPSANKLAYSIGEGLKPPFVLSPNRKWFGAIQEKGRFQCFNTKDGTLAGEINLPSHPSAIGFSPDGTSLAMTFGSQLAIWDLATGKPKATWETPVGVRYRIDRPEINWFGTNHLMVGNRVFDPENNITLCEFDDRPVRVAWTNSPDGRLWSAGNFKALLGGGDRDKKVIPGPIVDAGLKDKNLLGAYSMPHQDAKNRWQAATSGIILRPEEPLRIEVVGGCSKEAKQLLADTAAEEMTKNGKAVDPSAKIGFRVELSKPKKVEKVRTSNSGVQYIGPVPKSEIKEVYEIDARIFFINTEKEIVTTRGPAGWTMHTAITEPDYEKIICKGIGKQIGMHTRPEAGYFNSKGEDVGLPIMANIGIDGVVE